MTLVKKDNDIQNILKKDFAVLHEAGALVYPPQIVSGGIFDVVQENF